MKLTPHEEKVLELIKQNPDIVDDHTAREKIAELHGYTEKTLRNRIGDLKKYGILSDKNINLISPNDDKDINLIELVLILWNRKWLLIGVGLSTTIITSIIVLLLPLWFYASAVLMPPSTGSSSFGAFNALSSFGIGNLFSSSNDQNRYLAILKSRHLKYKVIDKFDLRKKYNVEFYQEAIEILNSKMSTDTGDENQIIISLYDKDQFLVASIVNYIVNSLDSIYIDLSVTSARQKRIFTEERVNVILDSLYYIEDDLILFMEEKGILSIDEQVRAGMASIAEIQTIIIQKEVEIDVTKSISDKQSPVLLALKKELESLRSKYMDLYEGNFKDQVLLPLENVPGYYQKLERAKRKIDYFTNLLTFMGPQYEQAKIEEIKDIPTIQVLDYAITPEKKAKPRRTMIVVLVTLLGGVLTAAGILIFESNKN